MIEIGKKFFWGIQNARQTARAEQQKYRSLAAQAEEQARALAQDYRADTAYLFHTAAEKMRQASQAALQSLAQRQARRAANGVSADSASAQEESRQAQFNTQLQNRAVQTDLQAQGAQTQRTFAQKWQALWRAVHEQRKAAKNTGRLGSFGRALLSLFE